MIILLKNTIDNVSLQVGDVAYYVVTSGQYASENPQIIGEITGLGSNYVEITNPQTTPGSDDFIMFSKNKIVNDSGITGYYADVKLVNNSVDPAELFALSSEVSESSK